MKTVEQFIQDFLDSAWDLGELPTIEERDAKLLNNINTFISLLQACLSDDELEEGSIQRSALLRLLEISTHALQIKVRNKEEDLEELTSIIESIFAYTLNVDGDNAHTCWPVVRLLSQAGFKLSADLMESIFSQQIDNEAQGSEQEQYESAVQAMELTLHDAKVDDDIGFYELYKTEFALLPDGAEEFIFSLLSRQGKSWTIDAILLFLLHPDDSVKQAILELVQQIPPSELANMPRLARLVCIRNWLAENKKISLDPVIKAVLKSNRDFQQSPPKAKLKEIYCSIADHNGAHSLLVIADDFLWGGILKQSSGIVDDFYIANMPAAQQQDIVKRMAKQFPLYRVNADFLEEVLPWFISKSVAHAGISPHSLLFLEQMPANFSQPQPISIVRRVAEQLNDIPTAAEVKEALLSSDLLIDDFPVIKSWLLPEKTQPILNENEVIKLEIKPNTPVWAERLLITSLIAKHASHSLDIFSAYPGHKLDLRPESQRDCLLAAHALLHDKDLTTIKLLAVLAQHALHAHAQNGLNQPLCPPLSYQIKLSLEDASPKIWRRLKLSSHTRLDELHIIIQLAMGWDNCHLYDFEHQGKHYGPQNELTDEFGSSPVDDRQLTIGELLKNEGEQLSYLYDFGDNWVHSLELEKIGKRDLVIPVVSAGSHACPPEDSGGIWGYKNLCRIIKNPNDPSYDEISEWLGEFNPKIFDKAIINKQLCQYFSQQD